MVLCKCARNGNRKEVIILTNGKLLKEIAKEKKITLQEIADAVGLTRQGLFKKIENRSEFKLSELEKISKLLGLTNEQKQAIFFAI